jgi:hypothetical protein
MEMADGQILTYHSHPDIPPPSISDIVWLNRAGTESVGMLIDKRINAPNLLSLEYLAIIIPQPSLSQLKGSSPSSAPRIVKMIIWEALEQYLKKLSSHGLVVTQHLSPSTHTTSTVFVWLHRQESQSKGV